jgi:hypothetical protein
MENELKKLRAAQEADRLVMQRLFAELLVMNPPGMKRFLRQLEEDSRKLTAAGGPAEQLLAHQLAGRVLAFQKIELRYEAAEFAGEAIQWAREASIDGDARPKSAGD